MSQNKIENNIGYHNLNLEELVHEISNSDNKLAKCFVEELLSEIDKGNNDKDNIVDRIRSKY
ncbi:hypothetical protein PBI_SCTP2_26 [Salicola phage SCTP-2]|nr:hypothetical protein PBI_SCTP2_26 [Salicola phage SCTP-2]